MNKKVYILLIILYKLSLEVLYAGNLCKIYNYLGVILDYNAYKMSISWIIFFLLIIVILGFEKDKFWFTVMQILFIFVIIPSLSLYGLKNIPTIHFMYNIVFWLIFVIYGKFFSNIRFTKKTKDTIGKSNVNINLIFGLFAISMITVLIASYLYGDFRVMIDFNDIYKYRLELREINMPVYFRYMLPFIGTIFLPICMMEFLERKKYVFLGLTLLIGLMLFSINGMKTWLLVYALVFVIYKITSKKYNSYSITNWILMGFIILSIVGYIISMYFNNNIISGSIHRMTILVQEISYYFIDFFYDKDPLLLRGSILRHILSYPYSMSVEFQIGGLYMGNFASRANNGLLGDAYANFKILGILIYPFMYSLIFKILQSILRNYNYKTNYFITFILIWNSMNSSFFTWLLTGGVIVVCLIYHFNYIMLRKNENNI
ncbi:O-antigen polymerase [Clostridium intestinale]|uniref:Oligosaccharide repeat unit polymerase n=1 Tax=Clostridium intestinale TaxID=36845 RepID=A0A7D7ACD6_9CLOT|nr:O-antigen polymerase [Clostridium intestinale]QLY79104.1 oligosaccharide repeat unit polymerase [Clostridium intestinale]